MSNASFENPVDSAFNVITRDSDGFTVRLLMLLAEPLDLLERIAVIVFTEFVAEAMLRDSGKGVVIVLCG